MLGLKQISEEREQLILRNLADAAELHAPFLVLVGSSAVIAAFGMLMNNVAIIIGAMLVAPLMTPIFALSVALIRGRTYLMRRAIIVEVYGVVVAIAVAAIIGLLVPEPEMTAEILARTRPTLFDLAVALAAGLAGAYALVREEVNEALPGVAIAVALMPPLAAVGLGVSMRRWDVAGGALVLFLANFVAIHLVSAAVFYFSGLAHHVVERNPFILLKNFGAAIVILLVMVAFLGFQLSTMVGEGAISRTARAALAQQMRMIEGAQLTEVKIDCAAGPCRIVATVETPQVFEPPLVAGIQNVLSSEMGREVRLVIRSVALTEASAESYNFREAETAAEATAAETAATELSLPQQLEELLEQQAMMVPGAELIKFEYDEAGETPRIEATYQTTAPFGEALETGIANLVRNRAGFEITVKLKYVAEIPDEPKAAE